MIRIRRLITGGDSGVEAAVRDFAVGHDFEITGYAIDGNDDYIEKLDTDDEMIPQLRNIEESNAVLVITPPRMNSFRVNSLIDYLDGTDIPHLIVRGREVEQIVKWLDSLDEKDGEVSLYITGPNHKNFSLLYNRVLNLLESILTADRPDF